MSVEIRKLSSISMIGDTRRWFYALEWIETVQETDIDQFAVFGSPEARDEDARQLAVLPNIKKLIAYDLEGDGMASQGEACSYIECNSRLQDEV